MWPADPGSPLSWDLRAAALTVRKANNMATVNEQLDLDARAAGYGVDYANPWRIITALNASDTNKVWLRRSVDGEADGAFTAAFETNSSGAFLQELADMAAVRTNLGL